MIQLAWLWLRHQPASALSLWFQERVRRNGGRLRKPMVVALARKLLIALWEYATAGGVIEGAGMRPAEVTAQLGGCASPGPDQFRRIQGDGPMCNRAWHAALQKGPVA